MEQSVEQEFTPKTFGVNILNSIENIAHQQQENSHADGPGYNDHSGDDDHTKG